MIFLYAFLTLIPHIGETTNEVLTMFQWQYARDTLMYALGGVAATVFLGLFWYWVYQDEMLQRKQKKELIRETIKDILKEEKQK
jgi:ABC-type Fe3+ transport system permease subunit